MKIPADLDPKPHPLEEFRPRTPPPPPHRIIRQETVSLVGAANSMILTPKQHCTISLNAFTLIHIRHNISAKRKSPKACCSCRHYVCLLINICTQTISRTPQCSRCIMAVNGARFHTRSAYPPISSLPWPHRHAIWDLYRIIPHHTTNSIYLDFLYAGHSCIPYWWTLFESYWINVVIKVHEYWFMCDTLVLQSVLFPESPPLPPRLIRHQRMKNITTCFLSLHQPTDQSHHPYFPSSIQKQCNISVRQIPGSHCLLHSSGPPSHGQALNGSVELLCMAHHSLGKHIESDNLLLTDGRVSQTRNCCCTELKQRHDYTTLHNAPRLTPTAPSLAH